MILGAFQNETTVTELFPDNPIAGESVAQYIAAMKSVYVRVADGRPTRVCALRQVRR
jgi:2-O-sulfo trehalose long-chain-acyltransferase